MDFERRVRLAHADFWEVEGRLRAGSGGGVARVRGARLSSTGLPVPFWNAAHLTDLPVDVDAAADWYAARNCPWGLLVPIGLGYAPGEHITTTRCMGVMPTDLVAVAPPPVRIRPATTDELERLVELDAAIFGLDRALSRAFTRAALGAPGWTHWLTMFDNQAIGMATARRSDLDAGPCGALTAIGVVEHWRHRGVGTALTTRASEALFDAGATLVHLNPDTEDAARLYRRIGYCEVRGFEVYRPLCSDSE